MNELARFETYKKKMEGLCDEHSLTYRFRGSQYPMVMVIRPLGGFGDQMYMMEVDSGENDISPDAYMQLTMTEDGTMDIRTTQTFTISDALLSKVRNLFRNLCICYGQYFHRYCLEHEIVTDDNMPCPADEDEDDMEPEFDPEPEEDDEPDGDEADGDESEDDGPFDEERYEVAVKVVRDEGMASTSVLMRRMGIGYDVAAQLLDIMELRGVIGPHTGSGLREVYMQDESDTPAGDGE